MNIIRRIQFLAFLAAAGLLLAAGCDDSGGGGGGNGGGENTDESDEADNGGETSGVEDCLVIGDGISKGVGLADGNAAWPELLHDQLDVWVAVSAQGGAETAYGAANAASAIANTKPSHLLILLGSNEVDDGTPPDEMQANYQTMIDAAKAAGVVTVIATLPPVYGIGDELIQHGLRINRMIRALASANGIAVVDLEKEFGTDRSLLQKDGLHPTEAGHVLIMAAFADRLD